MKTTIREFAKAIATVKNLSAKVTDGNIVGIDTVSGGTYFAGMPCVGSVILVNGKHKLVVDAIAYEAHKADSGKHYDAENRFVLIEFDPQTLAIGPASKRTNIGYSALAKAKNLGTVFAFVDAWDNDAERRAAEAARLAEAKRKREAAAQKRLFNKFI